MTPDVRLEALAELALTMSRDTSAIADAARVIVASIKAGGTLYACGNGGSHNQARHLAEELTGRYHTKRRPLPGVALGCNATGIANDYGHRQALARELRGLAREGDVLVCLSTSGTSANVVLAGAVAADMGLSVVAITGKGGRHRWDAPYHHVMVPTADVGLCQEVTLSVLHSICEAIDEVIE